MNFFLKQNIISVFTITLITGMITVVSCNFQSTPSETASVEVEQAASDEESTENSAPQRPFSRFLEMTDQSDENAGEPVAVEPAPELRPEPAAVEPVPELEPEPIAVKPVLEFSPEPENFVVKPEVAMVTTPEHLTVALDKKDKKIEELTIPSKPAEIPKPVETAKPVATLAAAPEKTETVKKVFNWIPIIYFYQPPHYVLQPSTITIFPLASFPTQPIPPVTEMKSPPAPVALFYPIAPVYTPFIVPSWHGSPKFVYPNGVVIKPKVYFPNQPLRNTFRTVTP
jgi:hypothetical protein